MQMECVVSEVCWRFLAASGKAAAEILAAGGSGGAASRWQDPDIAADVSRADALLQQCAPPQITHKFTNTSCA